MAFYLMVAPHGGPVKALHPRPSGPRGLGWRVFLLTQALPLGPQ